MSLPQQVLCQECQLLGARAPRLQLMTDRARYDGILQQIPCGTPACGGHFPKLESGALSSSLVRKIAHLNKNKMAIFHSTGI